MSNQHPGHVPILQVWHTPMNPGLPQIGQPRGRPLLEVVEVFGADAAGVVFVFLAGWGVDLASLAGWPLIDPC